MDDEGLNNAAILLMLGYQVACRGAATQSTARILIHAGSDVGASGSKSPLQWLRALCSAGPSLDVYLNLAPIPQ